MKYVQPIGAAANAPYIDANPGLGIEGSPVPAAAIEHPQREIEAVITGSGLVAATGDLTQLRQAIAKMIQAGQRAVIINNAVFAGAVTGTGKAVYWDSGNSRFDLALADGTVKQNCVGFADVANANVYAFGDAVLFSGLTPGARYYLDGTTAGAITATAPANAVFVGIARNATEVFVDIDVTGSSKIIASLFTATRAVVAVSGDTTLMTLNFTLTQAMPIEVDWRSWFGSLSSSNCYGNARIMLGAVQKSRSPRIHLGVSIIGYSYTFPFNGSAYLGVLSPGAYTVSLVWFNETPPAAIFNPGPVDAASWSQADSEIIVRSAL